MTTLATMYPGQINSPSTTLSGALSATATTVNVADASVLPTAVPFPLTIGIDSSQSETVLVTAINGNALTVTRGWDGTSSGWAVNTPCARVFTARDLNDLQDNVNALNSDKAPTSSVPAATTTSPKMDGSAAVGSETKYAKGDHVHPTDTSRQAKITANGLLKGDGNGGVTAATAGTDYALPSAIPSAYTSTPNMDGTGSAGSGTAYARGNHVHPTDTSRQAKITASGLLKGDGNGGVSAAVAGTDYQTPLVAGTDYATPGALADYVPTSQKGANNGVATLDSIGVVFNLLVAQDVASDVNDLQGGLAIVADNPVAVVLEDEVVVSTIVSGKHQLEAVGGICCQGIEGVARNQEQVNILTRLVVDKVQIVEVDIFGA